MLRVMSIPGNTINLLNHPILFNSDTLNHMDKLVVIGVCLSDDAANILGLNSL